MRGWVFVALLLSVIYAGLPANSSEVGPHEFVRVEDAQAQSNHWRHVYLRATDDTAISIDYKIMTRWSPNNLPSATQVADPVWINVEFKLHPLEISNCSSARMHTARAVWVEYCTDLTRGKTQSWQNVREIDLQYDCERATPGHYTARLPDEVMVLTSNQYKNQTIDCYQEIAIVRDGAWLQDPISGTSNFRFQLSNATR